MESTRQNRVGKQIQKDLSEIIIQLGKNIVAGKMLTITRVRLTPDLELVKAYVSIFPSGNSQAAVDELNAHASQIRFELGRRVRHQIRVVPDVRFYLDDSLDYIDNINNLLKE